MEICIVISNKKYAKGLNFAKKHNIKFQTYTFKNNLKDELKVLQILKKKILILFALRDL